MCKIKVNIVEDSFIKLWHKWLGYVSEGELNILTRKKLLFIKGTSLKIYTDYLADEQHRVAFYKSPIHRKSYVLDLIHIDICTMDVRILVVLYMLLLLWMIIIEKYGTLS